MIAFHACIPLGPLCSPPTVEFSLDRTYGHTRFSRGEVIHDGRVNAWSGDPSAWNGSFLAWSVATPKGEHGLTLFTDRLGTVPVYMARTQQALFLASSLCQLSARGFTEPDPVALQQVLLLGIPYGARTMLSGVELLPPASEVTIDGRTGQVSARRYWRPPDPAAGGYQGPERNGAHQLVARLVDAHSRIPRPEPVAFPVTAGLDSRANLATAGHLGRSSVLYHCTGAGGSERAIAKQVAQSLQRPLRMIEASAGLMTALRHPGVPGTGEIPTSQLWLADAPRCLAAEHGAQSLVDGYLQDVLLNPHLIGQSVSESGADAALRLAQYRWCALLGRRGQQLPTAVHDAFKSLEELERDPRSLDAQQRFYLENRSRRYTIAPTRVAQDEVYVALPGLDNDLMDFGFGLPWRQRQGGAVYREAIAWLSPGLARIPEGKTGVALTSKRRRSLRSACRRWAQQRIGRIGLPRIPARFFAVNDMAALVATRPEAREALRGALAGSQWLPEVLPAGVTLECFIESGRLPPAPIQHVLCNAYTIASLEIAIRQGSVGTGGTDARAVSGSG
jgi:hypothetical protein